MKKTVYIFFAAALALAGAACTREEITDGDQGRNVRTFTCAFADQNNASDEETRTDITKQGRTVWLEGDKLWVSNGTEVDTVTVPASGNQQKYFDFQTTLEGKLYVVYPLSAARSATTDGKFLLDIPSVQDGTFGSANIAVAVAADRYVKMRNVTSVLKFRIPSTAKPIKVVSVNSVNNKIAGPFSVDMSSGSPVVATIDTAYTADVVIKTDGLAGNFYATVIPGNYTTGFSMTAVSLDLANACETKTTVADKVLGVNDLYDLGRIGDNLKALSGDGSEGNPYQITNFPEMLAFSYFVNEGNTLEGKYAKVMNDISGVTTSVGYYDEAETKDFYFKGNFDGNGKTITLNMKQTAKKSIGLFGDVAEPAYIHDVNVVGSVTSSFDYAAGICGMVNAGKGVKISNCKSGATVNGAGNVGGIVGYCDGEAKDAMTVTGCQNTGSVTGKGNLVGGIVGNADRFTKISDCTNDGSVTGNTYVGGIAGALKCSTTTIATVLSVDKCTNNGIINGGNYTAGIVGIVDGYKKAGYYNKSISNSVNKGAVNGKAGTAGIVGWAYALAVTKCNNEGAVTTAGGNKDTGGIAGWCQNVNVTSCYNKGAVKGYADVAGIIAFCYWSSIRQCGNTAPISALWYIGGLAGYVQQAPFIINSYNTGRIFSSKNGVGICAGGLVGSIAYNATTRVNNCYNTGAVEYDGAALAEPQVGGIVGVAGTKANYFGNFENVYNSGRVGPSDGTAGQKIGTIAGWMQDRNTVRFCFGLDGSAPNTKNTDSATGLWGYLSGYSHPDNCSLFSADGTLLTPATAGTSNFVNVIDALNGNINVNNNGNSGWFRWKQGTSGPEFIYPDPSDASVNLGDNTDLGNGGNI